MDPKELRPVVAGLFRRGRRRTVRVAVEQEFVVADAVTGGVVPIDRVRRAVSARHGGRRQVIAQQYLPAVAHGNKRLFLLDGEVVGAVLRRPARDDFRIGPPIAQAEIDEHDRAIVTALGPLLRRHGLAIAGLDVIAGRLIEVNVTCPGGMRKTDALLGTRLSHTIVSRLVSQGVLVRA